MELITHYSSVISFVEAWKRSEIKQIEGSNIRKFRVIGLDDLINTKLKSGRNKDLLDVQELKRIHNL